MKPKDLIKQLKQNSWEIDRVHGSHYILKKGNETLSIPYHNKDIKSGLLNNILKKAGLK